LLVAPAEATIEAIERGVDCPVPVSAPEADVLRRFAAGDESAFSEVYDRYARPMYSVAMQVVGRRELAADAVQQAFVQAWRAAGSYDPEADIAPWLFTITRRAAIDAWRKERRHVVVDTDQLDEPSVEGPSLEAQWEAWQVRQALDELPPEEQEVVRMAYVDGLTQSETAERLAIPIGTVKSRTHRAHRRLGTLLAHLDPRAAPTPPDPAHPANARR
jgi:RNA polymerase sigma-70 factor (ECF subfamily)